MIEPKRLLEEANDPFAQDVLRSVDRDVPSDAGRRRAMAAMGLVGVAAGAAGSVAPGPVLDATIPMATTKSAATSAVGSALTMKLLVIGVVAAAVALGAITYGPKLASTSKPAVASVAPLNVSAPQIAVPPQTLDAPEAHEVVPVAAVVVPPASRPEPRAASPRARRATSREASPPDTEARNKSAVAPSSSSAPTPNKDTLAREVALVERARAALRANDVNGSSAALDEYDARSTTRVLGAQATALRVELLVRKGDLARARALGESFLEAHPNSPSADRVRTLVRPASSDR